MYCTASIPESKRKIDKSREEIGNAKPEIGNAKSGLCRANLDSDTIGWRQTKAEWVF